MRLFRRIIPLRKILILHAWLFLALISCSSTFAQSGGDLNPVWSEAVHTFVNKVAGPLGGAQAISLDVKNISSLRAEDVSALQRTVEVELTRRHIQIRGNASNPLDPIAEVHVTFSEGTRGFVLVAEIRGVAAQQNERQVVIVELAGRPNDNGGSPKTVLNLEKKIVWTQPDPFLDFALLPPLQGGQEEIVILDPDRLGFYHETDSGWQLLQSLPIPRPSTRRRDPAGYIDVAAQTIIVTGERCTVDFPHQRVLNCIPASQSNGEPKGNIPGAEGSEAAQLPSKCYGQNILLMTGAGDWTQSDSIQGFELSSLHGSPVASGDSLDINGPVVSLAASAEGSEARVVVYDLKERRYEGYIVTATCSH